MFYLRFLTLFIFLSNLAYCSQKDEAIDKAKEAFLIQSGIKENISKVGKYVLTQTHTEKPLATGLFIYKTVKDKQLSFPLDNKKITVKPNELQISIPF